MLLKQATTRVVAAVAGPGAENTAAAYKPGKWDIYMLGLTIVIGGQYFCWNAGVAAGLYSYFIGFLLIGTAYIALCCCTAEITGALPFAGGAYGLARCTLGFYPAFMIGCCEALEYMAYVSASTIGFVELVVDAAPGIEAYRPLLWGLFYLSALVFHIKGGQAFWRFNFILGSVSLLIVVLYCIGSLPFVNYAKYADVPSMQFVDGFPGFMKALPLPAWFFVGVEALPMASDQIEHAKHIVPIAQVGCVVTLFVTGVFVYFVAASLPPGLASLPAELVPFDTGFTLMLNIPRHAATVLSLPATYATAFGFIWCYGKLIVAMATSKLLPSFLSKTTTAHETPYAALIAGSSISYALCLVVYWVPAVGQYLFNICMLAAFMSYTGQCIGYISLKHNYRNIKSSEFRSPFGSWGAFYSMCVWLLSFVGIIAFQGNGGVETFAFLAVVASLTVFYFAYARKRQTFSPQENRIMLVAHVTKFNIKKVAAARQHKHQSASSTSASHHATGSEASEGRHSNHKATIGISVRHGKLDIFMLGITIVIGGQYFCWNEGINAGVYSFLIGYFLIASAYITLCCCTAEITGALPFAGGSYGLARCTLGFYPAFMVGCCEALEYIAALFIQIKGGRVFWVFNLGIGVVSLIIVVIYCLGALAFVNFGQYGAHPSFEFKGGFHGYMKALPLAAWFFVGVEALNLSSDQVDQPKKIVPVAQVSCVVTLFATGLFVYFVTVSLPPGIEALPTELVPLNRGFKLMFKISHHAATVLSLPATYATAFGFMWCYGKLIVAMATSRLLPKFLSKISQKNETPYGALLAGSAISYALCVISYFVPAVGKNLFKICILAAFMSYTGQCVGYISLKLNYRNIKSSEFQSPFGIAGALYSMVVWVLGVIAVVAFQDDGGVEIIVFSIIVILLTAFYFGYARKRQTFSAAENRVMLVAHVTKFNVKKVAAGRRHKTSSNSKRTGAGTETSQTENAKPVLRSARSAMQSITSLGR
ncbi:Amino Acid-Polyamine-Organocation (APC) Family [Phytophthora cinnamomi]|uniref:Amino Acid-Polyamine-Organocation (APC) Family n=1 Tax=Phytophthora cinnamomi TaxID=4785 RepID=UPI00355AA68C|nr:Amino Acid-Polyamine-Organocation (APC) Family [Phytophthora cinnamomi]